LSATPTGTGADGVPEWIKAFGQWLYERRGGWSFEQPVPQTLFKYYRPERFHVLSECRVRFSQRTAFDDERELRPETVAFGTEEEIGAYMEFDPAFRDIMPWLREAVIHRILNEEGWQQRLIQIAQSALRAQDEFGVFCLCERPDSDDMWQAYAANAGFVVAFDTRHPAFKSLRNPGKLGKVTYSDRPLGTFIGCYGPDAFFAKRAKYAFECEWRSIRALCRLQRIGEEKSHPVFVAPFDPSCINEILVRPDCAVAQELDQLLAHDHRYRHVRLRRVEPLQ
jgi:hypothetical protein